MSWLLFSHSLLKSLPIFLVIYLTAPLPLRSVVLRLLSLAEHTLDTCMSLSMLSQLPGPPAFPFCPNKAHVSLPRTVEVLHLCGSSTDYLNLGEFLSFLNFIALLAGNKSWVPPYALTYWASKSAVQSLSHVQLLVTPWTAACQASLSITNSWSLLKLMSIVLMMPPSHLILWCPLLVPPSIFPSIRVFSNEPVLCMSWPKY